MHHDHQTPLTYVSCNNIHVRNWLKKVKLGGFYEACMKENWDDMLSVSSHQIMDHDIHTC